MAIIRTSSDYGMGSPTLSADSNVTCITRMFNRAITRHLPTTYRYYSWIARLRSDPEEEVMDPSSRLAISNILLRNSVILKFCAFSLRWDTHHRLFHLDLLRFSDMMTSMVVSKVRARLATLSCKTRVRYLSRDLSNLRP